MWSRIINTICHSFIANLICDSWSDESAWEANSVLIAPPATFVVAILWPQITLLCYAGISIWPVTIPPRAANFFRQNPHPGDNFSVQNSGPRVEKMKQNPHPRA